jgi:hypothetical protein
MDHKLLVYQDYLGVGVSIQTFMAPLELQQPTDMKLNLSVCSIWEEVRLAACVAIIVILLIAEYLVQAEQLLYCLAVVHPFAIQILAPAVVTLAVLGKCV